MFVICGNVDAECIEDDGGKVARTGIADLAVRNIFACRRQCDIFFLIGITAVTVADSAVVGDDEEQRFIKQTFGTVSIIYFSDKAVILLDGSKIVLGAVFTGVTRRIGVFYLDRKSVV